MFRHMTFRHVLPLKSARFPKQAVTCSGIPALSAYLKIHQRRRSCTAQTPNAACNTSLQAIRASIDSDQAGVGLLGITGLTSPSNLLDMSDAILKICDNLMDEIDTASVQQVPDILQAMEDEVFQLLPAATFCHEYHQDPTWQQAAGLVEQRLSRFLQAAQHYAHIHWTLAMLDGVGDGTAETNDPAATEAPQAPGMLAYSSLDSERSLSLNVPSLYPPSQDIQLLDVIRHLRDQEQSCTSALHALLHNPTYYPQIPLLAQLLRTDPMLQGLADSLLDGEGSDEGVPAATAGSGGGGGGDGGGGGGGGTDGGAVELQLHTTCSVDVSDQVFPSTEYVRQAAARERVAVLAPAASASQRAGEQQTSGPRYLRRVSDRRLVDVPLDSPLVQKLLTAHPDEGLRRRVFHAGLVARLEPLMQVVDEVVHIRGQLASSLGHPSYGVHHLTSTLAGTPAAASSFLASLLSHLRPYADSEARVFAGYVPQSTIVAPETPVMEQLLSSQLDGGRGNRLPAAIQPWNVRYAYRAAFADAGILPDWRRLRPYFGLDMVIEGATKLLHQILGLQLVPLPTNETEDWDEGVIAKLGVLDTGAGVWENSNPADAAVGRRGKDGVTELGVIYLHLDPGFRGGRAASTSVVRFRSIGTKVGQGVASGRSGGSSGDTMFDRVGQTAAAPSSPATIRRAASAVQRADGSSSVQPETTTSTDIQPMVLAVRIPVDVEFHGGDAFVQPALLRTLMHELGHAVHFLLSSRHGRLGSCGVHCPVDVAEIPSHLFERLLESPRVLQVLLHHHATGEPLSAARCREVAQYFCVNSTAMELQEQALVSLWDLRAHSQVGSSTHDAHDALKAQGRLDCDDCHDDTDCGAQAGGTDTAGGSAGSTGTSSVGRGTTTGSTTNPPEDTESTTTGSTTNPAEDTESTTTGSTTDPAEDTESCVGSAAVDARSRRSVVAGSTRTEPGCLEVWAAVREEHASIPQAPLTWPAFSSIRDKLVTHGSVMYAYELARYTAASIWSRYLSQDPLDPRAWQLLRLRLLQPGNSVPPQQLLSDVLGQEYLQEVGGGFAPVIDPKVIADMVPFQVES